MQKGSRDFVLAQVTGNRVAALFLVKLSKAMVRCIANVLLLNTLGIASYSTIQLAIYGIHSLLRESASVAQGVMFTLVSLALAVPPQHL